VGNFEFFDLLFSCFPPFFLSTVFIFVKCSYLPLYFAFRQYFCVTVILLSMTGLLVRLALGHSRTEACMRQRFGTIRNSTAAHDNFLRLNVYILTCVFIASTVLGNDMLITQFLLISLDAYLSMVLQSFVGPWPPFQFLNPIHSR
jgi:hypothetical protein